MPTASGPSSNADAAALAAIGGAVLQRALQAIVPQLAVQAAAEVDSTNTRLVERVRGGETSPCLLAALQQTAGRGRQGRQWQSQAGASLTFSLALALAPRSWSGLSLAVGVAIADALDPPRAAAPPRLGLKWPNDVLIVDARGHRKVGGILIETVSAAEQRVAVIGVGLNLAPQPVAAAPASVTAMPSMGHGWLGELDPACDPAGVLARVAPALLREVVAFEQAGFTPLRGRYMARDLLAGRAVTTTLPGVPGGIAEGVDDEGVLWVNAEGRRCPIGAGEVSVRADSLAGARAC